MKTNKSEISVFYESLASDLCAQRGSDGFWEGRLSSSALGAAVAAAAMKLYDEEKLSPRVSGCIRWLLDHQNADGGYGDTPESVSNISTSLLCYGAIFFCAGEDDSRAAALGRLCDYLSLNNIDMRRNANIERSILTHYGKDFTFSVPILAMLAICGVVKSFDRIPQLPFELSLLPQRFFRFFNLQVVSYAIPALIAVGILSFTRKRRGFLPLYYLRRAMCAPALRKLASLMPRSGGFLEAIPLTAFVAMSLISSGIRTSVVERGISFLVNTQREDGSFAIDTSLSVWVTTLSIKALGADALRYLSGRERDDLRTSLLNLQYNYIHPFNGAAAGGWGWNRDAGSVPDADDTPGAILALLELYSRSSSERSALLRGCDWLVQMQNNDGGIPTFCRGWGRLPFDRSCADLTGHAFAALAKCGDILAADIPPSCKKKYDLFLGRALGYLSRNQSADGSWLPLWFGNQNEAHHCNPVYGTARIAVYLCDSIAFVKEASMQKQIGCMIEKALDFLAQNRNDDGGWGARRGIPSTQEESSLAVCALASGRRIEARDGIEWLMQSFRSSGICASPIGLYFASLWYDEKLYPHIFMVDAFRRYLSEIKL